MKKNRSSREEYGSAEIPKMIKKDNSGLKLKEFKILEEAVKSQLYEKAISDFTTEYKELLVKYETLKNDYGF